MSGIGASRTFAQVRFSPASIAQPPNPLLQEAGGTLHRAGTIAELAGLIGIAPQRLEDLVAAYDAAIEAGTLHLMSPPRRSRSPASRGTPRTRSAAKHEAILPGENRLCFTRCHQESVRLQAYVLFSSYEAVLPSLSSVATPLT